MFFPGTKHSALTSLHLSDDKHFTEHSSQVIRSPTVLKTSYTNASTDEPEIVCKRIEKIAQIVKKQSLNNKFNPMPITFQKNRTKSINFEDKYFLATGSPKGPYSTRQNSHHFLSFEGLNGSQSKSSIGLKLSPEKKEKLQFHNIELRQKDMYSHPSSYNIHQRTQSQPTLNNNLNKMSWTMLSNFSRNRSPSHAQILQRKLSSPTNPEKQKPKRMQDFDKLIERNAKKALAEKKKQKKREEHLRSVQLEKKHKLEEENRRIRLRNMSSWIELPSSPKYAWGVDQRKLINSRQKLSSSPQPHYYENHTHYKKLTDNERREMLGLDKNETAKTMYSIEQLEERSNSISKRVLSEEDREKIKEFMDQKQKKVMKQKVNQQVSKKIGGGKIKENLEKLLQERKEKIEKDKLQRKPNQSSSKKLLSQNLKSIHSRTKSEAMLTYVKPVIPKGHIFSNDEQEVDHNFLHEEYTRLIKEKTHRSVASFQLSEHDVESASQINHQTINALIQNQKKSQEIQSKSVFENNQMRKKNVKKRFDSLLNLYEKKLINAQGSKQNSMITKQQDSFLNNGQSLRFVRGKNPSISEEEPIEAEVVLRSTPDRFEFEGNYQLKLKTAKSVEKPSEYDMSNFYGKEKMKRNSENNEELSQDNNSVIDKSYAIIEAAAIFIQKIFRGYLTRKVLREYFQQLCDNHDGKNPQKTVHHSPSIPRTTNKQNSEESNMQEVYGQAMRVSASSPVDQNRSDQKVPISSEIQQKSRNFQSTNVSKTQNYIKNNGFKDANENPAVGSQALQSQKFNENKTKAKEATFLETNSQHNKTTRLQSEKLEINQQKEKPAEEIEQQHSKLKAKKMLYQHEHTKNKKESESGKNKQKTPYFSQKLDQELIGRAHQENLNTQQEKSTTVSTSKNLATKNSTYTHTTEDELHSTNQALREDEVAEQSEFKENTSKDKSLRSNNVSPENNHQKYSNEYKLRNQKSESDLLRDNIIAELRKIEQEAENQKETDADGLEKELDRANKQPKAGDAIVDEDLLKFEESAVGGSSWSEGRESNIKEIDSPIMEKRMKNEAVQTSQDSVLVHNSTQNHREKTVMSKPTPEQSAQFKEELTKLKEDQMNQWNDLISQLKLLKTHEGATMSHTALNLIELMQHQLENQKRKLESPSEDLENLEPCSTRNLVRPINREEFSPPLITKVDECNIIPQQGLQRQHKEVQQQKNLPLIKKQPNNLSNTSVTGKEKDKKGLLEIDTEAINVEYSIKDQHSSNLVSPSEKANGLFSNLELIQLRVALGSERLVREHLNTSNNQESMVSEEQTEGFEGDKDTRAGLFDRNPFKNFAQKKFKEIIQQENVAELINLREQVLNNRHQSQVESLKKMYETNSVSPTSFQAKKVELDRWITRERDQIHKSKQVIKKGWTVFQETVKRTNRDILFMRKINSGDLRVGMNDDTNSFQQTSNIEEEDGTKSLSQGRQVTDHSDEDANEIVSNGVTQSFKIFQNNELHKGGFFKAIQVTDHFQIKEEGLRPESEKGAVADSHREHASRSQNLSRDSIEDGIKQALEERIKYKGGNDQEHQNRINADARLLEEISPRLSKDVELNLKTLGPETKDARNADKIVVKDPLNDVPAIIKQNKSKTEELQIQKLTNATDNATNLKPQLTEADDTMNKKIERDDYEAFNIKEVPPGLLEDLTTSFKEQPKTELSLSSNLTSSVLSPLIEKEFLSASNRGSLDGLERKNLQLIFEQDEDETTIVGRNDSQPKESMNDLIDNLFQGLSSYKNTKLIMLPDPVSERRDNPTTSELEESKSDAILPLSQNHESKQILSPRLRQGVEHLAMEKAKFQEGEVETKKKPILTDLIENLLPFEVSNSTGQPSNGDERFSDEARNLTNNKLETEQELFQMPATSTDLLTVQSYIDFLIELITTFFKEEFLVSINTPTGLSTHEKLAGLHGYDLALLQETPNFTVFNAQAVLNIKIYLIGEEKIKDMIHEREDFMSDIEIIHNKAIFDAFNEALDYFRPHSVHGMPYPWKRNPKTLERKISEDQITQILESAMQKVLQWAQFQVGFLGRRIGMFFVSLDKRVAALSNYREEKLAKALSSDVQEKEEEWLSYDDQRMELQIELSDLVFEKITLEVAEFLYNIQQRVKSEHQKLLT